MKAKLTLSAMIVSVLVLLCGGANAQLPLQYALHNGSLMQITPLANHQVEISYLQPRPSLYGLVAPGMVLLRGQWQHDGVLTGTAFVFPTPPCPPVPYAVIGSMNPQGVLTVVGAAPLINPYVCAVVGMVWSNNSTLVFTPQ
jgi:hypothetical protein